MKQHIRTQIISTLSFILFLMIFHALIASSYAAEFETTPTPQLCTYDYLSYTAYAESGCEYTRHRPQEVKDRLNSLINKDGIIDEFIEFPSEIDEKLWAKYPYLLQE